MGIRIAKFIADSGAASRRAAEKFIIDGRVKCNGQVVARAAFDVEPDDKVELDGKEVKSAGKVRVFAFFKPLNTIVSVSDPQGRRTIYDILPKQFQGLKYVGRLDFKTDGLLLMTTSGNLARQLTLPDSEVSRVYMVKVSGWKGEAQLAPARGGMTIDKIKYRPMKIDVVRKEKDRAELKVEITEGKNREIRNIMFALGLSVSALRRVKYGDIKLGDMKPGEIREVDFPL
ncbi:MAG: pseudouridine synthase [Rickettsiales bacterium]|jgi:23S rRNA pseudouridine2605 synthase|nr:pseudouridine synthase [Rickettsiales bacterium]